MANLCALGFILTLVSMAVRRIFVEEKTKSNEIMIYADLNTSLVYGIVSAVCLRLCSQLIESHQVWFICLSFLTIILSQIFQIFALSLLFDKE